MPEANPFDTRGTELRAGLETLVEKLAATHENVDPAELRSIFADAIELGFEIRRAEPSPTTDLVSPEGIGVADLATARDRAEQLLRRGEPLLAYDLVGEALTRWPNDLRLHQLEGLALSRSGAIEHARQVLQAIAAQSANGETRGLLAGTIKTLGWRARSPRKRDQLLEEARRLYEGAWREAVRAGDTEAAYYNGINAATLACLGGDLEQSREMARGVRELCQVEERRLGAESPYWLYATLGEAHLLLGERHGAENAYGRGVEHAGSRFADICTTRRQARRILEARREDPRWLDAVLRVPPVAVFAGHMIDRPERPTPRFDPKLESAVAREIRSRVSRLRPAVAYCSAACGADLLCVEALREQHVEYHLILPFAPGEFRSASVEIVPGDWGQRFERALEGATSVTRASDHQASGSSSAFVYAGLIQTGLAELRAIDLETDLVPVVVWNGRAGDGLGGTAWMVEHWRSRGQPFEWIDLAEFARAGGIDVEPAGNDGEAVASEPPPDAHHPIMAMLFADTVGYSRLSENQIPLYVDRFMGRIARLLEETTHPPLFKETVGDGFYFVFENVRDAGCLSLELRDLIRSVDWAAEGLPETLGLRAAVHCGPLYLCHDPITGEQKYTGPHTNRTAQIEPITPPGEVYATQAFAAVAAATGVRDLEFDYVGRKALAKKYGFLGLYHLRRAAPDAAQGAGG
jgi:class 3 adenylate cyclase